ncbi:MAG TPA: hypothetical protein VEX70_08005 [Pyrinomonadaceae bacterium]|jgi:hypothetical protein|nr:hypothetical protein [Pyrinomonadaceae bacterium]
MSAINGGSVRQGRCSFHVEGAPEGERFDDERAPRETLSEHAAVIAVFP